MTDVLNAVLKQLEQLLAIIPNIIAALSILLVGVILAKVFRRIVIRVLEATGIDKLADRFNAIDLVAGSNLSLLPSRFLGGLVYYVVFFVFIIASVEALGMDTISALLSDLINYLPKAFSALIILILGLVLCDLVKKAIQTACDSLGIPAGRLLSNAIFYFLFLNVVLVTMKQAELQTTFMENNISIVLGGVILAFALGYGLASRSMMSNMLASYYNKEKFAPGDEVTINNTTGKVIDLDNTTLTLRVEDGELIVPLHKLSAEPYTIKRVDRHLTLDQDHDDA